MCFDLPLDLAASAYRSVTGEPAWSKADAIAVIEWATQARIAVLGVEVWLPTSPGPTIPLYQDEVRQIQHENWDQFVMRANGQATDYVKNFDWNPADTAHRAKTPFFNLTLLSP